MKLNEETLRFVFGLKLRNLRKERDLSLAELSQTSGLSASYLNEIEKGKKYPKADKIEMLSRALQVSIEELTRVQLNSELHGLSKIMDNTLLGEIPFEIFGFPAQKLFEGMSEKPQGLSSLITSFLEIVRLYDIRVEDFFSTALSSYIDRHKNYFPDMEKKAAQLQASLQLPTLDLQTLFEKLLKTHQNQTSGRIQCLNLGDLDPHLKFVKFIRAKNSLLINQACSTKEKCLIVAREIGYQALQMEELPLSSEPHSMESFEHVFQLFQANYFAAALLLPKVEFLEDIESFFGEVAFSEQRLQKILEKYPAPPETIFQRISQLVPQAFQMQDIYLLRMDYSQTSRSFDLVRELHLSQLHAPHGVRTGEHYCRRWISTDLIRRLKEKDAPILCGIQRSLFQEPKRDYLCISAAARDELDLAKISCFTLGISLPTQHPAVQKWSEANEQRLVSSTCEQCQIKNCGERVAVARSERNGYSSEARQLAIARLIASEV